MSKILRILLYIAALSLLVFRDAYSGEVDDWQMMQLMDPTRTMLLAEANGRINIYDGMPAEVVNRALDTQFDRIDSMMFTRIRHSTEKGEVVEDDGC